MYCGAAKSNTTSLRPSLQSNTPTVQTCAPRRQINALPHRRACLSLQVLCFTAEALTEPKGRPLALHSHPKQRALFQAS